MYPNKNFDWRCCEFERNFFELLTSPSLKFPLKLLVLETLLPQTLGSTEYFKLQFKCKNYYLWKIDAENCHKIRKTFAQRQNWNRACSCLLKSARDFVKFSMWWRLNHSSNCNPLCGFMMHNKFCWKFPVNEINASCNHRLRFGLGA